MILRYSAPINGHFLCVYNWQNIRRNVYSIGHIKGYVSSTSKCFKTVAMLKALLTGLLKFGL